MTMPSHSEFTTDGSSDTYKLIACEVCGSKLVPPELNLGQQAMCDDLVKVNDPRVCKRYPIEISLCPTFPTHKFVPWVGGGAPHLNLAPAQFGPGPI